MQLEAVCAPTQAGKGAAPPVAEVLRARSEALLQGVLMAFSAGRLFRDLLSLHLYIEKRTWAAFCPSHHHPLTLSLPPSLRSPPPPLLALPPLFLSLPHSASSSHEPSHTHTHTLTCTHAHACPTPYPSHGRHVPPTPPSRALTRTYPTGEAASLLPAGMRCSPPLCAVPCVVCRMPCSHHPKAAAACGPVHLHGQVHRGGAAEPRGHHCGLLGCHPAGPRQHHSCCCERCGGG